MAIIAQVNTAGTIGQAITATSWGVDSITNNGAGTLVYDADSATGSSSARYTQGTGALFGQWSTAIGTRTDLWFAAEMKLSGYATASNHFFRGQLTGATTVSGWAVDLSGTGQIVLRDSANANVKQTTAVVPLNTWVRVEGHAVQTAGTGTLQVILYSTAGGLTVLEDTGVISGSFATGTNAFQFGPMNTTPQIPVMRVGACAVATSKIGAFTPEAAAPPTVSAGPDQFVSYPTPAHPTGSATAGAGTTLTGTTWTQVSGPACTITGANTLTPTITPPAGQTPPVVASFQLTATEA